MFYDGYHVWGMHLVWWFVWMILLGWIFFAPSSYQEIEEDDPFTVLKIRLAKGEISKEDFEQSKKILKSDN